MSDVDGGGTGETGTTKAQGAGKSEFNNPKKKVRKEAQKEREILEEAVSTLDDEDEAQTNPDD